jgi:hypothetical protein
MPLKPNSYVREVKARENDECQMTNDERMSNDEARMPKEDAGNFVIRASSFFRHSSFDIRHCREVLSFGDSVASRLRPSSCCLPETSLPAAG